jgi:hypothetical protein
MKGRHLWGALAVSIVLATACAPVAAQQQKAPPPPPDFIITGVEVGGTGALAPLERFADNGFIISPYGGYMLNRFLGAHGHFHWIGLPLKDSSPALEDDWSWAIGLSAGPRVALPLGGLEVWGTFEPGFYTGLSPHSPITDSSWGFTTGGGMNLKITDHFSFGGFARYNRLWQRAHGVGDVRFASGGITLQCTLPPPSAAPPPPK